VLVARYAKQSVNDLVAKSRSPVDRDELISQPSPIREGSSFAARRAGERMSYFGLRKVILQWPKLALYYFAPGCETGVTIGFVA
jgi:hypothetical protein